MNIEDEVLAMYRKGSDIGYIIVKLNTTYKKVDDILKSYKDRNKLKKSFTHEFKVMVASRDLNGTPRRQIAEELSININTVKKFCEDYGQHFKDKSPSDNETERIEIDSIELSICPSCKSKRVNIIEQNITYCKDCGSEHEFHSEGKDENKKYYALKINWQYVD